MSKVNKELKKFIDEQIATVGTMAIDATKEVIDAEAQKLYENIKAATPVRSGKLAESLTKTKKTDKPDRYGYTIDYDGYNEKGVAFSYIARSLNKGTRTITATRHIDQAVRKLKGLDDRINKRFLEKINK